MIELQKKKSKNLNLINENNKKKPNVNVVLLILVILSYFFLITFIPQYMYSITEIYLFSLLSFLLLYTKIKYKIKKSYFLFLFYILLSSFEIVRVSETQIEGYKHYMLTLVAVFLMSIILISISNWKEYLLRILIYILCIYFVGAVIQYISPNLLYIINNMHMTMDALNSAQVYINKSINVGFTSNPGINGYFISIIMFYFYTMFLNTFKKINKYIYLFLFIFSFILLINTGKRGFLLFSVLILMYLTYKHSNNFLSSFVSPFIIVLLISYVFFNTEMGINIIERTQNQVDVTTGRADGYQLMFNFFEENIFIGNGIFSINEHINISNGHNIYLQLLAEQGLLAFIPLVLFFIINVLQNIKLLNLKNTKEENQVYLFSLSVQLLFLMWGATGNSLYDTYPLVIHFIMISIVQSSLNSKYYMKKREEDDEKNLYRDK